ncbi:DUF3887 domain-containing protein [Aquimarina rhabdastrellae]
MRYLILILFLCLSRPAMAQDTTVYDKVLTAFSEQFNAENVTGVHDLYSNEMKEYMPLENATQFINGMHKQFGNIKSHKFVSAQEGVHIYHIVFDKGTLSLELQIDAVHKITGIVFDEL